MKIGFVSRFPPEKCGIAIYSDNLARQLEKSGIDIIRIGTESSDADYNLDFCSLNLDKKLKDIIKRESLELMHFQYIASYFAKYSLNLGFIKSLNTGIPNIVTLHEVQYDASGLRTKILAGIERRVIRNTDKAIVHTPNQKTFLDKKYRLAPGKTASIFMGLSLHKEHKKRNRNILFFGLLNKRKGIEYLIRAADFLSHCRMKIYGASIDSNYTDSLRREAGRRKNIELNFSWISEKRKKSLFEWADVVVLPYTWASYQSAVLHDAFSYGLPAVVTRTGAIWEIVDAFKCGEIVNVCDEKSIARGIENVLNNYQYYKDGVMKYRKKANWAEVAKEHKKLYQEMVQQ